MKVYVDGNGLLECFRTQEGRGASGKQAIGRRQAARWLARYCEASNCDVTLVFDGNPVTEVLPPTERLSRVTIVNVPYGRTARDEIAGPANRAAMQERVLVVTADYRLTDALARGQARTMSPAEFLSGARKRMRKGEAALADEPDEKFTGLTDEEVGLWLDFFGGED
jgi:predicted RNA-binding protein with PIN domain